MNDNYLIGSGDTLNAGWPPYTPAVGEWSNGTPVGSISDFTWTPGRDEAGVVTLASKNSLPLNTWVRVSGTSLGVLRQKIIDGGFDYATGEWSSGKDIKRMFKPWTGACDDGKKIYYPRPGGHEDSSMNGVYSFDIYRMEWVVERQPSNPFDPVYPWAPEYRLSHPQSKHSSFTNYWTFDAPAYSGPTNGTALEADGLLRDMLPDGTPTSSHTYNGHWWDSKRNQIGNGRISKWTFDLATKQWSRQRWTIGGELRAFSIRQEIHYYAPKDCLFGYFARTASGDYYSWGKVQMPGAEYVNISASGTGWQATGIATVRMDEHRIMVFWVNNSQQPLNGIFNMETEKWEKPGTLIPGGYQYAGGRELMPAIWIPNWGSQGQVLRSNVWNEVKDGKNDPFRMWIYDPATNVETPYTPPGAFPTGVNNTGNKCRCIPSTGLVFWVDDEITITQPAMHVMRIA